MSERRIKLLESSVSDQILASSGFSNIHHVAEELILNSIDAQSTNICLDLNIEEFRMKVVDNGKPMLCII
ncbi:hypothetical protein EON65_04325 [archaeon]|nr:MAG: hypothetical protein EON65_04325 [archaeon]